MNSGVTLALIVIPDIELSVSAWQTVELSLRDKLHAVIREEVRRNTALACNLHATCRASFRLQLLNIFKPWQRRYCNSNLLAVFTNTIAYSSLISGGLVRRCLHSSLCWIIQTCGWSPCDLGDTYTSNRKSGLAALTNGSIITNIRINRRQNSYGQILACLTNLSHSSGINTGFCWSHHSSGIS